MHINNGIKKNNDLEIARNILHNATKMNISKDLIEKISQKLDEYINAYYRAAENEMIIEKKCNVL